MRIAHHMLAAALAATMLAGEAAAEHEADHRYVVRGFVLDQNEDPLGDVAVTVRLGDETVARARTDRQGYYSAHAHLHDADIGRELLVLAGKATGRVTMTATRGDQSTKRVHHVNFVGDRLVEGELGGLRFPAWVYTAATAATGLLVVGFLAHRVSRARRRARRQAARAGTGTPHAASAQRAQSQSQERRQRRRKKRR